MCLCHKISKLIFSILERENNHVANFVIKIPALFNVIAC